MARDEAGYWKPDYSYTDEVAAEARAASRRYWERVNVRFPVADDIDRSWPLNEPAQPRQEPKTERGLPG